MNGPIDYTGYGYSSGGFAPTAADSADARRNKQQMDKMSDYMQKLDPVLNRTLETLIRTQVRNGATPEEARRAAFGSSQGQLLSDFTLGMRRTGFLGQGDPINYGRNILQGVSGGGFSVNVQDRNGGASGLNQGVMGGGMLAGQASMQMAKDLMTQLYGKDGADPREAYGHNMEQASMVFRKLSERGALGNVGTFRRYSDDKDSADYKMSASAVDEKLANARRQEVDPLIKAALEGTSADNIGDRIAEATKKGDKQVAEALGNIQTGNSTFALDDKNTKRVAEITKETLKGLSNLKDIYGDLSNPQLLAQMESLTGIRITNQAESRKAANMTSKLIGSAEATGNDPAGVISMVMSRMGLTQQRVAAAFGAELGEGGTRSATGKRIAAGMANATAVDSMETEAAMRDDAARTNSTLGTAIRPKSKEEIMADNEKQNAVWSEQNKALALGSGLAETTFKDDKEFTAAYRNALSAAKSATTETERAAANSQMERVIQDKLGRSSEDYLKTGQGTEALANADWQSLSDASNVASAAAARTDLSDQLMRKAGMSEGDVKLASQAFRSRLGTSGMERLAGKSKEERATELKKMVSEGYLSEAQSEAVVKNMESMSDKQFAAQMTDVGNSSGGGRALYDVEVGKAEASARANKQQREAFSDDKGLSVKSIANAILSDPKKNSLNTDTKRLFALEAMQKAGLAGDLAPVTRINTEDGFNQEEMDKIRKATGDDKFAIHTKLGFESEADMIAAQAKDPSLKRKIQRELDANTSLISGGTPDDMYFANADQNDAIKERASRFEMAAKYKDLVGMEQGASSEALDEYMKTGKWSQGGLSPEFKADGKQDLYDSDGDGGFFNWNDEKNNPEDKAHFSQALKFQKLAARVNSKEEGADMIAMNAMTGGSLVKGMEDQLKQYEDAKSRGMSTIETVDKDGKKQTQNADAAIKELTDAIAKLKSDDGQGKVVQEMTVSVLKVERQEPN